MMASIARDKNGTRRILFVAPDGKRKTIRLGKVSQRTAESIKCRVEHLLAAKIAGHAMDADTARWVSALEPRLAEKLAAVGLIPKPDNRESVTLGDYLDAYIESRTDVKPLTVRHLRDAARKLVTYFGADRKLVSITPGDADEYRRWLLESLGPNTVRRLCGRAKQFFRAAVRKRLLTESPFADMKDCAVRANRSRDHFVSPDVAAKVLEACPDAQWRAIFALARFGGLRVPSEILALRWEDVDFAAGRMVVRSPKTEHHEGKEFRVVPLFAELRPYLEEAYEIAEPGTVHVITRYRQSNVNLRTQLLRILERAGVEPWPKLFHNLRATRQTELQQRFPVHVVCTWLGNTQAVAMKHYLQVTEEHFAEATGGTRQSGAKSGAADARNSSQSNEAAVSELGPKAFPGEGLRRDARYCTNVQAPPVGLEPTTQRLTAACSTN